MKIKNLKNKPLVEAILEFRWDLKNLPDGSVVDEHYELLVGQLRQSLIETLPSHVKLPFAIHGVAIPYQVQHQFRRAPDSWPLAQLGPGILTINETENYESDKFLPFCEKIYSTLLALWKQNGEPPKINYVCLRYIDADIMSEPIRKFLTKLGINISYEERLLTSEALVEKEPKQVNFQSSFDIKSPEGIFNLSLTSGKKNGQDALLWETQVVSNDVECQQFISNPSQWLSHSHKICHEVFFGMIQGELEKKYE